MNGRTPRRLKVDVPQPVTVYGSFVTKITKSTSAMQLRVLMDDYTMAAGTQLDPAQVQALDRLWSQRYTAVCKQFGVYS